MKTIDNDIKAGDFKKVYLLYGQERYLIKQYRDKLIKAMVSEGDSMNFSSFEGDGINQKEIIDLAETLPFFADKRVILIEDAGIFSKAGDELGEYLKDSPESTHFIFVEESVDKRSKLYKAAAKCGNPVEFKEQTDETLARWIGMRIRKDGKGMSQAAYNSFIEKTGTDMENIDKELEKLLCYCMDKDVIELSDVETVTTEQITNEQTTDTHYHCDCYELFCGDCRRGKTVPRKIHRLCADFGSRRFVHKTSDNRQTKPGQRNPEFRRESRHTDENAYCRCD